MGMNIDYCSRCQRIYPKNQHGVCANCLKEIENQYEACVKFLRENRASSLQELSDATEVPVRQIAKFIRDGRISIKNLPNMAYGCEVCGTDIREGHICDSCRSKLAKDVNNLQEDAKRRAEQSKPATSAYQIKKDR